MFELALNCPSTRFVALLSLLMQAPRLFVVVVMLLRLFRGGVIFADGLNFEKAFSRKSKLGGVTGVLDGAQA